MSAPQDPHFCQRQKRATATYGGGVAVVGDGAAARADGAAGALARLHDAGQDVGAAAQALEARHLIGVAHAVVGGVLAVAGRHRGRARTDAGAVARGSDGCVHTGRPGGTVRQRQSVRHLLTAQGYAHALAGHTAGRGRTNSNAQGRSHDSNVGLHGKGGGKRGRDGMGRGGRA